LKSFDRPAVHSIKSRELTIMELQWHTHRKIELN
jgi:hypothetical protein